MSNYQIILDETKLDNFIEWLPKLLPHETYMICLFARNKYIVNSPKIYGDKECLSRKTTNKERLKSKIRQLECAVGSYTSRGQSLPQESLALYITVNPRDLQKAAKNTLKELANVITENYNGYNPHAIALSEIQKAYSRKEYLDFDFDHVEPKTVLEQLKDKLNLNCLTVLKTRGGFHLLVKTDLIESQYKKSFYNSITEIPGCDVKGDPLTPVPGCTQGGFIPHFLEI